MTEQPPPLTYEQTSRILAKLTNLQNPVILIGGQAVNFWASYYMERVRELAAGAPYASNDVDFCGTHRAVRECAARLGGHPRLATLDDVTPNTGIVTFVDDDGIERVIDFLGHPGGLEYEETVAMSIAATILTAEDGTPTATFRVMHPILCLESRVFNVARLDGYDTPHALKQLRATIMCAREFIRDLLVAGEQRAALRNNERIFRLAKYVTGLEVFVIHNIDLLEAVLIHADLPAAFHEERLPRIKAQIERKRTHVMRVRAIGATREREKNGNG